MNILETGFADLKIIQPRIFADERGYFYESYNQKSWKEAGILNEFVQDNQASSTFGVLRGLHYQTGDAAQAKLVRVLQGNVLDVVVDLRTHSDTFGKVFSVELSAENQLQMLVPRGFAHGYVVLSPTAIFFYKCDNYYSKPNEGGVNYADNMLNIDWKINLSQAVISEKDKILPTFEHRKI
jgi:dTDP-4-dehydrorhamnose 3,5-epimerase